jgi:hypothetical protein
MAPLDVIEFGLKRLTDANREEFRQCFTRLANGGDTLDDMYYVLSWVGAVQELFDTAAAQQAAVQATQRRAPPEEVGEHGAGVALGRDLANDPERHARLHRKQRATVRQSHHVYGSRAALCIEPAEIEPVGADQRDPVYHSLAIEVAAAKAEGRSYLWDDKIVFRLTKREFPLFIAVLMGFLDSLKFGNHGPDNDKSLEVADQGGHLFIKLRQGVRLIAIQVGAEEVFSLTTLALNTIARNTPDLDSHTILEVIQRVAVMTRKRGSDKAA